MKEKPNEENKNVKNNNEKNRGHKKNPYIEKLESENQELKNKVLEVTAELVNYRKRKDEETSNRLKYANQDLLGDILLVLDNFERAINLDDNNLSDELSKFLVGFKMIYAQLTEILRKEGVEEIDALHKQFDPTKEDALMVESDENYENDIVLDVLLKGYTYKDRILRPVSCKVNKIDKPDTIESIDEENKKEEDD